MRFRIGLRRVCRLMGKLYELLSGVAAMVEFT